MARLHRGHPQTDGRPIGSTLVAQRSAGTTVTLPGGLPGQWSDIREGETVEAGGTYDDVSATMLDTDTSTFNPCLPRPLARRHSKAAECRHLRRSGR